MKHELKRKHAVILTLLLDVCLSGWVSFFSESSDDVVTHADASAASRRQFHVTSTPLCFGSGLEKS